MEIGTLRAFKKKKGLEVELWSRESFVSIGGVHGDRERERERAMEGGKRIMIFF